MQGGGREGLGAWRGEGVLRAPGHRACCPVRGQWEWPLAELTAQPSGDPAQLYTRTRGRTPRPAPRWNLCPQSRPLSPGWSGQHQRGGGGVGGHPFIFTLLHLNTIRLRQQTSFLWQIDSRTLSLGREFHNTSWAASGPSCPREGPLSSSVCHPTSGREHTQGQGWRDTEWTLVTLETHPRWWWSGQRGPQTQQEPGVQLRGLAPASRETWTSPRGERRLSRAPEKGSAAGERPWAAKFTKSIMS